MAKLYLEKYLPSVQNAGGITTALPVDFSDAPSVALPGAVTTGAQVITDATATAFAVGPNGSTNPVFQIDASTTSAATGLKITGAAAGAGVSIAVISSGSAENLKIDAKGTGFIQIGSVSTGVISLKRNLDLSAVNLATDTTTGTKIGTATTQKLGFFNATPVVQPAASADATSFVAGGGTTATSLSTWTGASGSSAYTVGGIVTQLKALGLLAA